jgi:hypothetical protein
MSHALHFAFDVVSNLRALPITITVTVHLIDGITVTVHLIGAPAYTALNPGVSFSLTIVTV